MIWKFETLGEILGLEQQTYLKKILWIENTFPNCWMESWAILGTRNIHKFFKCLDISVGCLQITAIKKRGGVSPKIHMSIHEQNLVVEGSRMDFLAKRARYIEARCWTPIPKDTACLRRHPTNRKESWDHQERHSEIFLDAEMAFKTEGYRFILTWDPNDPSFGSKKALFWGVDLHLTKVLLCLILRKRKTKFSSCHHIMCFCHQAVPCQDVQDASSSQPWRCAIFRRRTPTLSTVPTWVYSTKMTPQSRNQRACVQQVAKQQKIDKQHESAILMCHFF